MSNLNLSHSVVCTDDVIGVKVQNLNKEDLGKIEEIVIEKISGKVCYLVLSFGGFLGMGDKLFAIPWDVIRYDSNDDVFILNIDKEKLKQAPGFDKNHRPNFGDQVWGENISTYYKTKPYWKI